jgi:hypothetical protein
MPCVIAVFSKKAEPSPSSVISSSSRSTWSLSLIDSAFGCSTHASRTVLMRAMLLGGFGSSDRDARTGLGSDG